MKSLVSIFFLTLWSLSSIECKSFNMKSISQFMKPIFKSTLATSLIATSLAINPIISHAAVGEGDLPPGAMAFSKVLKYQEDWKKVADSLAARDYKIDDREITNVKLFLKQLANEYYDMELLTKSISDQTKVTQAKEIMKDFRSKIRECDGAASDGNIAKIGENYPITSAELAQFLDLLRDVPDEL